jgi:hypothetical protein
LEKIAKSEHLSPRIRSNARQAVIMLRQEIAQKFGPMESAPVESTKT